MPAGFQHEIRQHLAQSPPIDEVTNTPFVDLENYCCGMLSSFVYIEYQTSRFVKAPTDSRP